MKKRILFSGICLGLLFVMGSCGTDANGALTDREENLSQELDAIQESIEPLDILAELEQVEEQSAQLEEQITTYASSQLELNLASRDLYYLWDEELNDIWSRLKELLSEEEMSALTTEELEWIAFKEAEAEAAGSEYEGGSMQPMIMNLRKAELTRERVYELAAYLGEQTGQTITAPGNDDYSGSYADTQGTDLVYSELDLVYAGDGSYKGRNRYT